MITKLKRLADNTEYKNEADKLAKINGEKAALESQLQAIEAARWLETEAASGDAVALALKVVDGTAGLAAQSNANRLAELRTKIDTLGRGARAQREIVEAVAERLTAEANRSVQAAQHAALRGILAALKNVALSVKEYEQVPAELNAAGFPVLGHILPAPHVNLRQFDESVFDSAINVLARQIKGLAK
jgi:hypothetical protein